MGRVTEYFDFIKRMPKPDKEHREFFYTHIDCESEEMLLARKTNLQKIQTMKKIRSLSQVLADRKKEAAAIREELKKKMKGLHLRGTNGKNSGSK